MRSSFRHLLLALFLTATRPYGVAHADFEAGRDAYNRNDYATALREWRPLAEQGNAKAQFTLGAMYDNGYGVPQDYKQALAWYRKAAEQGHAKAQYNLGVMYANGQGVPQDYKQAVAWYRKAAEQGYAGAQFNLGVRYANGQGVPQDYKQAVAWYRKAAEQGDADAQNNLGVMYEYGQGVPKDYKQAVAWYRKAAEQGYATAQSNLGWMYANGRGVPKDYKQAVAWYRKAAEQGNANAQANLGVAYDNGQGVPQDDREAVAWYRKAAEQGFAGAQKQLDAMYAKGRATSPTQAPQTATANTEDAEIIAKQKRIAELEEQVRINRQKDDLAREKSKLAEQEAALQQQLDSFARRDAHRPVDDLTPMLARMTAVKANPRLHVLAVGINDYRDVADVPFAERSAQLFAELAKKALGAKTENVLLLTDTGATSGQLRGRINTLLNRLEPKDSLLIYYAGHGAPAKDGKSTYLLAQDAGPGLYEEPDLQLDTLYAQIEKSRVGQASLFIDACFSGRSGKDTLVFEGVGGITLVPRPGIRPDGRLSVMTAGRSDQFSNQDKAHGHRLFGYHLMKVLLEEGTHQTAEQLHAKLRERVRSDSRKIGPEFEQEPELLGNARMVVGR